MATRRPARSAKQKKNYDDEQYEQEPETAEYEEPVKKRAKKTKTATGTVAQAPKKNVRGKRGLLSQLTEFPLDVLFEIFGYLAPYDLLKLARTTKELRQLLFNSSNAYVWKDARSTIEGLPDKPDDMSEPAFAHLSFDPVCHICGAPNIRTVFWAFQMRLCQSCMTHTNTVTTSPNTFYSVLPSAAIHRQRRSYKYKDFYYSVDMINRYQDEHNNINAHPDQLAAWNREKKEYKVMVEAFDRAGAEWLSGLRDVRSEELEQMRKDKREAVSSRLRDLGWGKILDRIDSQYGLSYSRYHPIKAHKSLNNTQKLTERAWAKIQSELLPILEDYKTRFAEEDRRRTILKRCETAVKFVQQHREALPLHSLLPRVGDYLLIPRMTSIVMNIPMEQPIDLGTFSEVSNSLLEFGMEWLNTANGDLLNLLPSKSRRTTDDLHLATSIFGCTCRADSLWYPNLIGHNCPSYTLNLLEYTKDGVQLLETASSTPWKIDRYHFSVKHSAWMEKILSILALDPNTITYKELERCNRLVELISGNGYTPWGSSRQKCFATPIDAIVIAQRYQCHDFSLPSDEYAASAQEKYRAGLSQHIENALTHSFGCQVECGRCDKRMKSSSLVVHLQEIHNVHDFIQSDVKLPSSQRLPAYQVCVDIVPDPAPLFWEPELIDETSEFDGTTDLAKLTEEGATGDAAKVQSEVSGIANANGVGKPEDEVEPQESFVDRVLVSEGDTDSVEK